MLVSNEGYFPFQESGCIFEKSKSSTWKTPYIHEVARSMKKKDMDIALISEVTGMQQLQLVN